MNVKSPFGDMEGWKTKVSTIGGTFTGLAMCAAAIASDMFNIELFFGGLVFICGAWGLTGHAHKIDKLKKVLTGANQPVEKKSEKNESGKSNTMCIAAVLVVFMVASLLLLSGCPAFHKAFPPSTEPVCEKPEAANSLICKYFKKLNIQPEQYEDVILTSIDVAVIVDPGISSEVKHFVDQTRKLKKSGLLTTPASMFTWVKKNKEKSKAISNIISRKFEWMENVEDLFDPFDNWLIDKHLDHIEDLL